MKLMVGWVSRYTLEIPVEKAPIVKLRSTSYTVNSNHDDENDDPSMEFEMIYKHLSGRQMLGTPSLVESSGCWNYQGDEEHDD